MSLSRFILSYLEMITHIDVFYITSIDQYLFSIYIRIHIHTYIYIYIVRRWRVPFLGLLGGEALLQLGPDNKHPAQATLFPFFQKLRDQPHTYIRFWTSF